MSARKGILSGGNWIVDKLKFIDTYPQQDALANILTEMIGNGGSPFNVLLDLARLGASFPLAGIGLIGADAYGDWIHGQCDAHGVDRTHILRHATAPTSYMLLLDLLDQPDAEFGTAAARVLHAARDAGFKTSIDVVSEDSQRFADIVLPALRHTDYCIMNEFEIERTTGIPTKPAGRISLSALESASCQLLASGVGEWVIVHFPEGACALGHDGKFYIQGSLHVPQERMIGTVGAGGCLRRRRPLRPSRRPPNRHRPPLRSRHRRLLPLRPRNLGRNPANQRLSRFGRRTRDARSNGLILKFRPSRSLPSPPYMPWQEARSDAQLQECDRHVGRHPRVGGGNLDWLSRRCRLRWRGCF